MIYKTIKGTLQNSYRVVQRKGIYPITPLLIARFAGIPRAGWWRVHFICRHSECKYTRPADILIPGVFPPPEGANSGLLCPWPRHPTSRESKKKQTRLVRGAVPPPRTRPRFLIILFVNDPRGPLIGQRDDTNRSSFHTYVCAM